MARTISFSRYHSTLTSPRIDDTPVTALTESDTRQVNSTAATGNTPAPETDTLPGPQPETVQTTIMATEAQAAAQTLTIYPFAGDNILNGVEGETEQIIRGMTTGVAAGRIVNITVGDYAHATATVQADGSWSTTVHPSDMYYVFRYNGSGIMASVSNADGTYVYASSPLTVNYGWPSITLHAFTGDDIISGPEGQAAQRLSGSAGFVEPGQTVTVTLNEKTYTAQVGTDGNWYIDIPAADMATLPDGAEITATVSNARGQQAGDSATLTVNSSLPSLTLNAFATDNVLSDAEAFRSPNLSGTTTGVEAGQTVTITLNGKTYTTVVAADGSFSAAIPAADLLRLYNGEAEISATATNLAGEATRDSLLFTAAYTTPRITVNPIAEDDYINGLEAGTVEITGSAPSVTPGSVINLTFGNASFSTQVQANGTWRIPIEGMFMHGLPDGQYTLTFDAPGSAPVSVEVGLYVSPLYNFPMRIDTPFGDGVLTSAEAAQDQTLTGSTGITGAGQRIELRVWEWRYETTVDNNGEWAVTIPAGALQEISGTRSEVFVVAYDFAGNLDYEEKSFEVAFGDANLTINPVAGDNIINAAEAAAGIVLSGTANASAAGLTLTVTLNGVDHRTTITSNGSWSVPITTAELVSLPDGTITATVALPGSTPVNIDVNVAIQASPVPAFDNPFGDSVLTAEEAATDQLLTGTTGVTGSGQSVVVTLNGKTYAATVDDSGHWQATLPSSVLQALPEGGATLKVIATDAAGYSGSDTLTILVDQITAPITIYPVTGDNLVNFDEALNGITLSGITDGLPTGTVLVLTLGGNTYTSTTGADGSWTYDVSEHDIFSDWWQASPLMLTVTAPGGQSASTVIGNYIDNRADPMFNQPFGDGILTLAEAATDQLLTGKTGMRGAGQTVVVTLESEPLDGNGASFTGSVDENGNWSVILPSATLQTLTGDWVYMLATVTDIAGNSGTAEQIPTLALTPPTLTINPFAGDNDLSYEEGEQDQTLSGTLYSDDGEGVAGLTVTINMLWAENGEFTYTALTDEDGKWQVTVPATDLAQLSYGWASLIGTVTDDAGNTIRSGSQFMVSLPVAGITLDPIAGDNVLTGSELGDELVVSGGSQFLLMPLSLRVTINGITHRYDGTGPDWAVTFTRQELAQFPDGPLMVTVTSYDPYFNEVNTTSTLYVDLNTPILTLDPIAGDNIINAAEAAAGVTISGQSSEAGGVVSVQLNGVNYDAAVNDEGNWQLTLPNSTLAELEDGRYTLTVTQTAANGQTTTVTESLLLDADPANRPVLRIHTVSGDNVLNGAEIQSDQIISGSSENVESGQTLSLKIGGVTYTTQVQAGGVWSLVVPAEVLAALGNGGETLRASVTDVSGNRATASRNLTIKSDRDGLSIDPVTGDNLINAADAEGAITLTGHTDGVHRGATVHLTLNGEHYTAKVGRDGSWSATVPAADVAALEEGNTTLTACVKSACGQMLYAKAVLTVDTSAPELAFNPVTGDNLISVQEAQAGFALTGSAGIAAAGLLVLVVLNGVDYHATVQASGDWSVAIPPEALAEQPAGDYPLTVSLTDVAGNLTSISSAVTLEAAPDAATTDTTALTAASQASTAGSADSTLTAALVTPEVATPEHGTYTIGGQTLDISHSGGEAIGGSGNDTIVLHTLDFLHIDGGSGTDTLLLAGSDQHLDLTALGLKIENIDIFDLGNGSNSLTLGRHEAQTVTDQPEENLLVLGAAGSQLTLAGEGSAWETSGQREVDGLTFDVYHATGLENADLLVQQGILVQQV